MNRASIMHVALVSVGIVLFSLSQYSRMRAQGNGPIIVGQRVKIHSSILNEDRMLWITSPDTTSDVGYPVLYLLDGDTYFVQTVGIMQFLMNNGKMPQMIVVGLLNTNRNRDLTPLPADTSFAGSGGADKFLEYISRDVMPYVEAHYHTAPYRVLVGHSFGGIFALNALLCRPQMFNAYILISPSLWWGRDTMVSETRSFLRDHPDLRTFVYETVGDEGPGMVPQSLQFRDVLQTSHVPGLRWKFKLQEADDHGSIVLKAIYDALESLFTGWEVKGNLASIGLAGLEEHFAQLSRDFGFTVVVPEQYVNVLGYQYLAQNKTDDALAVFKWNIEHYPRSWNVYDSYGEALARKGETREAIKNYERSIVMNPENTSGVMMLKKLRGE